MFQSADHPNVHPVTSRAATQRESLTWLVMFDHIFLPDTEIEQLPWLNDWWELLNTKEREKRELDLPQPLSPQSRGEGLGKNPAFAGSSSLQVTDALGFFGCAVTRMLWLNRGRIRFV